MTGLETALLVFFVVWVVLFVLDIICMFINTREEVIRQMKIDLILDILERKTDHAVYPDFERNDEDNKNK